MAVHTPHRTHPVIALIGNPNTGKTTVFNRLTGLRQRIANYPGVTVEKKVGTLKHGLHSAEVIDLPGTYSLAARSLDERVVVDVLSGITGPKPDLVVCVIDAANLKRNLFLASQVADLGLPMVLVLNQWDAALKKGFHIDVALLEQRFHAPIITTVALTGEGVDKLRHTIFDALKHPRHMTRIEWPESVQRARQHLYERIPALKDDHDATRLLFDNEGMVAERISADRALVRAAVQEAREELFKGGLNPGPAEAVLHYRHIEGLLQGATREGSVLREQMTDSVDRLLLNRVWGTFIFLGVMWLVFQSVYSWSGPIMDWIEASTGWVQGMVAPWLEGMPVLQSLVVDGVIAGVGGVVVFLPQIFVLFFFIGLLEDTGYMARAAFLMDKLLGWCGLNGKSFVPLLSSYACAIPGVMAARTMEDPKARLTTILMAPFMSCSARLPVYVLLIGAFIEPLYGAAVAGWTLFVMHLVGALVALPLAWLMNRFILRTKPLPFVLEMPPYRSPRFRDLFIRMWESGREFLVRAGTIILAFSIIIWALLYFPRNEAVAEQETAGFIQEQADVLGLGAGEVRAELETEGSPLAVQLEHQIQGAYVEQSFLGRFGKTVQPVFAPAGFDWKITVGVLSSFPAREVIIATMGIIYRLGADTDEESQQLREIMAAERWSSGPRAGQPVFTVPVVLAIMVFFALCLQCGATVAVVAKELSWRWAVGLFVWMTVLAWVAAVAVYQVGRVVLS